MVSFRMNIFVLHWNPRKAARWHADKHVVKMLLESVQMLYTTHWVICYPSLLKCRSPQALSKVQKKLPVPPLFRVEKAPFQLKDPTQRGFRPVHVHHPCTRWVRESIHNYMWLCSLAVCLAEEHQHRWPGSLHSCSEHAKWLYEHPPRLSSIPQTHFAIAMPDEYKKNDPIQSYRSFYSGSKKIEV